MESRTSRRKKSRIIALCQIKPTPGDPQANIKNVISWMKRAAKSGADLALFGELVLQNGGDLSETVEGPALNTIAKAAKELDIAVIYGYSETEKGTRYVYNSLMFLDSRGKRVSNYRQAHPLPTVNETSEYTPGNALTVVDWDAGMKVGLGISADVCMAEYVRAMVKNGGAQLVVIAGGVDNDLLHEKTPSVVVPARALENHCYIAYVSLAGEKHVGMSRVCDPKAECLVSTTTREETMLIATIPLVATEKPSFDYDSLRRPELYNSVVAYEMEIPWGKVGADNVQHFFSHRALYYDHQMEGIYNGPQIAAHALAQSVEEKGGKVLDVAAGTGLVGEALLAEGFTNLVALDRSEEMLKCLRKKKVYEQIISGAFEEEAKKLSSGSFDSCVCVGAFLTSGFLNPEVTIEEMVRLVKKEGIVLLLWNATELLQPQCQAVNDSLKDTLENMVKSGSCKRIQEVHVPNYLKECEGSLCILQKA